MINRDCLFLSGESGLTMKVVFRRDRWMHTCSASTLYFDDGTLRRKQYPREHLKAIVFYADMVDKRLELLNLEAIKITNTPCWPNINSLINMIDRHKVLKKCQHCGFVNHDIYQLSYTDRHECHLKYPFVIKSGNTHRGENKFLIQTRSDLDAIKSWKELATFEPYFEGDSVRALVIGDKTFGIKIDNDISWIKNSSGANMSIIDLPQDLIKHAQKCTKLFDLDVAGVDYIVDRSGKFYFLEVNQFPGVAFLSEEITQHVEKFLDDKLQELECAIAI